MTAHTPTPWTVGHGPGNEVEVWGRMQMNASPILMSLGVMEHDPREANAAFIVRAVNSHDALVKALQTAIRVADEAREAWDKAPAGMKAGKLLIALSDPSLHYRADISEMHAVLASIKERA